MDPLRLLADAGKGPPKDVEPNQLMRILMAVEQPSEVLPFPRNGADNKPVFEFRMRVLTQYDLDVCAANAEKRVRLLLQEKVGASLDEVKHVRAEAWEELYQNARLVELLYSACRQVDEIKRPLFDTPDQMRKALTQDEMVSLYQAYQVLQYKFGPQWRDLTDEEIDQWVERLVKGVDAAPLALLGPGPSVALIVSLAYRLRTLTQDTGSSGSPASDGTSEESATASGSDSE